IRNVAAFDGSAWSPLGVGGPDDSGSVMATCLWNDNLVVVGNFSLGDRTQPVPIGSVAIWNGTTWSGLGQPIYGAVQACAVLDNTLYVGGQLSNAQGESLGTVARWTGTAWEPLGGGTDAPVYAMAAYNGRIYIGGDFTEAGGVTATGIAAWNGTAWEPVSGPDGEGVNGTVGALFVYRNELIVGARLFTMAGGLPISSIARWNGTLWQPLGPSLKFPATIAALTEYNGKLIVGGQFTEAGNGLTLNNIGQWDGDTESWSMLGSGTNRYVLGFARVGNDLIAGGQFTTMDGLPSAYVARLGCQADPACNPADVAGPGQSIGPDNALTADDIIVFLNWFFASDDRADVAGPGQSTTPDRQFTADDIIVFLNRFFVGC
ncbi:MAG: GC-type dockerin domain-anchored protein, partial [bacterium]